MQRTAQQPGITFAVDAVTPAAEALPEWRMHEALKATLGPVESCSDYHGTVVAKVYYHPLLAAVYTAFSQHRPLVLSPDAVWVTIAQGVAHHMVVHGERLRDRFVAHPGRLALEFRCRGWVAGSPENPWPEAFASWSAQIREYVGPETHDALVCDFSTTGPTERAASQVVLIDVFERYFHYLALCICGIPSVTLEGKPSDWERLAEKAAALERFDLAWWLEHLLPICDQFARASRGDVDLDHWQAICKLRKDYGGDVINGWVARLFPYLRAFTNGPCTRRNPIFETGDGFQSWDAPSGLSRVPFTWRDEETALDRPMEAVGGLVGMTQDRATLTLRPRVGWAVRAAEKSDVLLDRLARDHATFPSRKPDPAYRLPEELCKFYHRTDGAHLYGRGEGAAFRILPAAEVEPLDSGEQDDWGGKSFGRSGRIWHRFGRLADGSWLAINLDLNKHLQPWSKDERLRKLENSLGYERFAPICHGSDATWNQLGRNPVVALSFTELLERLLDGDGRPYWLAADFSPYGDAELFTRRS